MKQMKKYHGVVVPMVTPLTATGAIDPESVNHLIDNFVEAGVSPLLMGTTGEGNSLSHTQAVELTRLASKASNHRVTIYACLTGLCVEDQLREAESLVDAGADVLASTLPGYYSLTDEQIYQYYTQIADHVRVPFMLYNIKATTHMSIPVDVVLRLADHPNIVGLKDSERNDPRMEELLSKLSGRSDFSYFCGCAANSAKALALGADGIVPSGGNFIPKMYASLFEAGWNGDTAIAESLQTTTDRLGQIYQQGFTLGESLAALKVICHKAGLITTTYMVPPLTQLDAAATLRIEDATETDVMSNL